MDETPQVVVVGAASRDIVADDPRGWRLGGGATYSALTLARLGLRVGALVVADPSAAGSTEMDVVRAAGVDVRQVPGAAGPVFVNVETPTGRVQRSPQVSDPALPAALPASWRRSPAWMLVPVAAEIGDEWAAVPPDDALVAVGWQGLVRILAAGATVRHRPPGPSAVVRRADLISVGSDDIDGTTTPAQLAALLHRDATLLITDGARGGTAYRVRARPDALSARPWSSIPTERYVDPVGAGDTFLAGVFAGWLEPSLVAGWAGPDPALRLGAACASLVLEGPGLHGVPHRDDALRRMHAADTGDAAG